MPQFEELPRDQKDAVHALALHLLLRFEQDAFKPLDADGRIFLTVSHMQRLLRGVGAQSGNAKKLRVPNPYALSCVSH